MSSGKKMWRMQLAGDFLRRTVKEKAKADQKTFERYPELAKEANVGEMWLTHYSPSLTKPEHYMNDVKKIFPRAKAGKDGMSVDLMFED